MTKVYNLRLNTVTQLPDYIARIRLKVDHIKNGGNWCLPHEVKQYCLTPNVPDEAPAKYPEFVPESEVKAEQEMAATEGTKRKRKKTVNNG